MPNPNQWDYQKAVGEVLWGLGRALVGHTMALFTSHASLRAAANIIRPHLEIEGIRVLAQGIDGSPRQIMRAFMDGDHAVLLGASSFWEGVDLPGGILKAVVVARLPFHVPTEPVFAARSELYEDPFNQYAVPRAALRFRQGVGRLIRGSNDRGTIVVLDPRVVSRPYGKTFLSSMPPCTEKRVPLKAIAREAARWVQI
jgi:DNA polymerase-3 subunit epsilon/ATP-dependent DNA helicase DinG